MFKVLTSALVALSLILYSQQPSLAVSVTSEPQSSVYKLRMGDSVSVSLLGQDEAAVEGQPIRPDGRLSIPLIGEVDAAGLTVDQLKIKLTQSYARLYLNPQILVFVSGFYRYKVSVVGMVLRPGSYASDTQPSIMEAIALAGGLNSDRADLRNLVIYRSNGERDLINLQNILDNGSVNTVILHDGDTLSVGEVWTPDLIKFAPAIVSALSLLTTIVVLTYRK